MKLKQMQKCNVKIRPYCLYNERRCLEHIEPPATDRSHVENELYNNFVEVKII